MSSASSPPPVRTTRQPPQTGAPRVLLAGRRPVVLGATSVRVGEVTLPVEQPKGLGLVDGRVVVLDAPASAPGRVRVRRIDPSGAVVETPPGSLVVPFAGRAYVLPGAGADDLVVVSWESRGAISRVTLAPGGLVPEAVTPFAPTGPPVLAAGPDRSWARWEDGALVLRAPDGQERRSPWPAALPAPRHLAWVGGARWAASLPDGSVAVVGTEGALARSAPAEAPIHHLAADGEAVVALLFDEDPDVGRRELSLARLDLGADGGFAWRWRVPVSPGGPAPDCWAAVGDGVAAVGGSWGILPFDAATGEPAAPAP